MRARLSSAIIGLAGAAMVLTGGGCSSVAYESADWGRWEYREFSQEAAVEELNREGAQGWKVIATSEARRTYLLARPQPWSAKPPRK